MVVEIGKGKPNFNQSFMDMGTGTKLIVVKEGITHLMRGQMLIMQALLESTEKGGVKNDTKEKLRQWVNPAGNQSGDPTGGKDRQEEGHDKS